MQQGSDVYADHILCESLEKGIDGKILKYGMETRHIIFRYNPQIYANLIDILYEKSSYIEKHNFMGKETRYNAIYRDMYKYPREYHYNMAITAIRKTDFYFKHVRLG